jgi:hypothetical protein
LANALSVMASLAPMAALLLVVAGLERVTVLAEEFI